MDALLDRLVTFTEVVLSWPARLRRVPWRRTGPGNPWFDALEVLAWAAVLGCIVALVVVAQFETPAHDRVFYLRMSGSAELVRGDRAVVDNQVRMVVGLPGDTVRMAAGVPQVKFAGKEEWEAFAVGETPTEASLYESKTAGAGRAIVAQTLGQPARGTDGQDLKDLQAMAWNDKIELQGQTDKALAALQPENLAARRGYERWLTGQFVPPGWVYAVEPPDPSGEGEAGLVPAGQLHAIVGEVTHGR